MRYVIGVCLFAGLLIWDVFSNHSRFINGTVMELRRIMSMIGV